MASLTLDAQVREITGRKVKKLRRQGLVPVVIYGKRQDPEHAQVDAGALGHVLSSGGTSQLVEVNLEGQQRHILIREVQRDPVRHNLLHADFYAVSMTEKQRVHIPVVAVGEPASQSIELVMVQALDQVEIEALPADIPAQVEVDVSRLESPESEPITVAELPRIEGVTYLTPDDEALFSLVVTRAAVEEEEEEEEAMEIEVEPELIRRGREEEEMEDEE